MMFPHAAIFPVFRHEFVYRLTLMNRTILRFSEAMLEFWKSELYVTVSKKSSLELMASIINTKTIQRFKFKGKIVYMVLCLLTV